MELAQKMGVKLPFKDWADVLEQVKQDMLEPAEVGKPTTQPRMPVIQTYAKSKLKAERKRAAVPSQPTISRVR